VLKEKGRQTNPEVEKEFAAVSKSPELDYRSRRAAELILRVPGTVVWLKK
jgi:hypothetical protein